MGGTAKAPPSGGGGGRGISSTAPKPRTPGAEQRGGHVEALAVQRQLQHLGAAPDGHTLGGRLLRLVGRVLWQATQHLDRSALVDGAAWGKGGVGHNISCWEGRVGAGRPVGVWQTMAIVREPSCIHRMQCSSTACSCGDRSRSSVAGNPPIQTRDTNLGLPPLATSLMSYCEGAGREKGVGSQLKPVPFRPNACKDKGGCSWLPIGSSVHPPQTRVRLSPGQCRRAASWRRTGTCERQEWQGARWSVQLKMRQLSASAPRSPGAPARVAPGPTAAAAFRCTRSTRTTANLQCLQGVAAKLQALARKLWC